MTTDEELSELVDQTLYYAEKILGREICKTEFDKLRIKHDIVGWLAILKAVTEFMENHRAAPRPGQTN